MQFITHANNEQAPYPSPEGEGLAEHYFQIGFFNDKMKPDSLTKPIEHKVKSDFSGSWTFTASQSGQKTLTENSVPQALPLQGNG